MGRVAASSDPRQISSENEGRWWLIARLPLGLALALGNKHVKIKAEVPRHEWQQSPINMPSLE